jgi:uncharacterized membrane protein (UPF0136 family)
MLTVAKISMLVLCVLVAVGGIIGFLKAQSRASLISGIVSGALLGAAYYVSGRNASQGMTLGAVICAVLCIVFGIRFKKTGKFMPAGMLLVLCVVELGILGAAIATHQ